MNETNVKFSFVGKVAIYYLTENVRLTGGPTIHEGRVEVFVNGQWGTVCGDGISTNEAETLCQSLGFGPYQSFTSGTNFGDSTDIPLKISDLMCSEYHDHFMKCTFNQLSPSCSSQNSLALKCYRKLYVIVLCRYYTAIL